LSSFRHSGESRNPGLPPGLLLPMPTLSIEIPPGRKEPRSCRRGGESAIIEIGGGGGKMRQVVVYRGEDEYWIAECPSLPGCVSQGKSKEQAITSIKEAIKGYVAVLEEDNLPVPEEKFDALLVAV
jgi:predicted RNase H-like HicB family nuclease